MRNNMKTRRKLFSDSAPVVRRKLFSKGEEPTRRRDHSGETMILCSDCGHRLDEKELGLGFCSKCGSTRQNVSNRRSLFENDFQKEFSKTNDPLELKLKEFSGKEISKDLYEKEFGDLCDIEDLKEKGYASVSEDGGVKISDSAFLESRIFSKIIVSITKEYNLIPDIMMGGDKSSYIDSLNSSPKCIAILKKVHGVNEGDHPSWLEDSGIVNDLGVEFGGKELPGSKFREIIDERYPDAPEDIMDKLKSLGIIREGSGNIIRIK